MEVLSMKPTEVNNKLLEVKQSLQTYYDKIYDIDALDEITRAEHKVLQIMKDIIDDVLTLSRTYCVQDDIKALYAINCLKSSLAYSKQQFLDSGIDWLPSINFVNNKLSEAAKFDIAEEYIDSLKYRRKSITEDIHATYIVNEDKTVVWHNVYVDDEILTSELAGWYHGEPNEESTQSFSGPTNTAYFIK